jgi:hypothetical protein
MIGAVLRLHTDTEAAERSIDVHRDRLRHLSDPERDIDDATARQALDTAQRQALAVNARTAPHAAATAVLAGLRRRDPPPAPAPPAAQTAAPARPADLLRTR